MSVITQVSVEEQLHKNPTIDKQAIAELKEWISDQNHLPNLSETELMVFYVSSESNVDEARTRINNYFVMRHYMPELFVNEKNVGSDEIQQSYESVFIAVAPHRSKDDTKIIMGRLMDLDPSRYNFENAVKVLNMIIDAGVHEDGVDNKYVFVFDVNGATTEHVKRLSWMGVKKFYDYIRKSSPIRWEGTHYYNSDPKGNADIQKFIECNIASGNFGELEKIRFHDDIQSVMKSVGITRAQFPKEMGGEGGPGAEMQKQQVKKLETLHSFFSGLDRRVKMKKTDNIPEEVQVFGPKKAF